MFYFLPFLRSNSNPIIDVQRQILDRSLARTGTVKIRADEAKDTYRTVGTMRAGWFSGLPQFDVLEAREGVSFEYKNPDAQA